MTVDDDYPPEAFAAMSASISRWERVRDDTTGQAQRRFACETCPLCAWDAKQIAAAGGHECDFCPISHFVGRAQCEGTPYYDARGMFPKSGAVQAEVDFLHEVERWMLATKRNKP